MKFGTINTAAIHSAGRQNAEGAHLTPVFASSTFTFENAEQGMDRFSGKEQGYIYSRFGNPTTTAAQEVIAALEAFGINDESGRQIQLEALLHSSGQAAMVNLFLSVCKAGDAILANNALYGGTFEFLKHIAAGLGIQAIFADFSNLNAVEQAIKTNRSIKLIHVETPSNPTLSCVDLAAVASLAKTFGIKLSVDNTIATPYLQQPFRYGADFVFHSTTKFLNGHGTAIGGVLIGKNLEFMRSKASKTMKLLGSNSNPFDAFLLVQGIKTLPIRMDRHCQNAMAVASFLSAHKAVEKVNFNGLSDHADYALTQKQMRLPGAVMSFELKGGIKPAKEFINKLKVCVLAVSLGTVDTLVSHPASMSHAGMDRAERLAAGITDGLIRMSVGIEGIDDLLEDLDRSL